MFQKIKSWLRRKLFANEELEYQAKIMALASMKENASVVALAREQLKGFNPRHITLDVVKNRHALSLYDGLTPEEEDALITNIHQLYTNPALQVLLDYITRNQVLYGQMEADSLLSLNFSRGTVNGLILLRDEINAAEGVYRKRHTPEEDFNQFSSL